MYKKVFLNIVKRLRSKLDHICTREAMNLESQSYIVIGFAQTSHII